MNSSSNNGWDTDPYENDQLWEQSDSAYADQTDCDPSGACQTDTQQDEWSASDWIAGGLLLTGEPTTVFFGGALNMYQGWERDDAVEQARKEGIEIGRQSKARL